jgi:uncharacterized protein
MRRFGRAWGTLCVAVAVAVVGTSTAAESVDGSTPMPVAHGATGDLSATSGARPARFDHTTVEGVSVTMDDGVRLVGDVMYPADQDTGERAAGRFPVLLTQNPYACHTSAGNLEDPSYAYFVERGYILASMCVRGTGRSGGEFGFLSRREARDGVALVDWAAHRLSGSNGTVGLTGCSYLGQTQIVTAAALQPGSPVKAIMPRCWGAETYREAVFAGGMPTATLNYFPACTALIGPSAVGRCGDIAQDILTGGDRAYRRGFWRSRDAAQWADEIVRNGIPAMLYTGWDDIFAQGALEMYARLQNVHADRPADAPMSSRQDVTGRYQVVMGPWAHDEGFKPAIGLRWFDTWLKGRRTGMAHTARPMHLYRSGSHDWVKASHYPGATRRYTSLHLRSGNRLSVTPPTRRGGADLAYTQPSSPGGSVSYTTRPLGDRATLAAGPVSATLFAASSGENLHLVARLYDVSPQGEATEITSGSIVGSLRTLDRARSWLTSSGVNIRPYGRFVRDRYLTPGRPYRLVFRLFPRLTSLAAGHRLRLTITTQTPEDRCAAALGRDPCFPTTAQARSLPGRYRLMYGPDMPSAVHLPLRTHR